MSTLQRGERKFSSQTNLDASPPKTSGYILLCLSSYDDFVANEYDNWEIAMDKGLARCCMCVRRNIKNVVTSLLSHA